MESKNPQRDKDIITRHWHGQTVTEIAAVYAIGPTRVRQIILQNDPLARRLSKQEEAWRLRNESIACWRKTGMTLRELGRKFDLSAERVRSICDKQARFDRHRYKPKVFIISLTGLAMKPGAIWHTWYLDPNRRD